MKFSIGDKIVLKRTGEEGIVSAYINEQMLEVEVNDVKFPVYNDDIDHPYLKWFTEKKLSKTKSISEQLPVEKEQFKKPKLAKGAYLSFLPVYKATVFDDEVEQMKIYLINELPNTIYYQYTVINNKQERLFQHQGKLHGFGQVYLHTIPFETMNEQPRFHWELTDADNKQHTESDILKIKPQKLFQHIRELLEKNEPTFSYLLVDGFVVKPKVLQEEQSPIKAGKNISTKQSTNWKEALPRMEIDLHLENLTENTRGLSNADKLHIQLDALRQHLRAVIANKQERTIIIHGLGKGVLKDEVHKILSELPEVHSYNNDWHGKYGFGATEVWFKY